MSKDCRRKIPYCTYRSCLLQPPFKRLREEEYTVIIALRGEALSHCSYRHPFCRLFYLPLPLPFDLPLPFPPPSFDLPLPFDLPPPLPPLPPLRYQFFLFSASMFLYHSASP